MRNHYQVAGCGFHNYDNARMFAQERADRTQQPVTIYADPEPGAKLVPLDKVSPQHTGHTTKH